MENLEDYNLELLLECETVEDIRRVFEMGTPRADLLKKLKEFTDRQVEHITKLLLYPALVDYNKKGWVVSIFKGIVEIYDKKVSKRGRSKTYLDKEDYFDILYNRPFQDDFIDKIISQADKLIDKDKRNTSHIDVSTLPLDTIDLQVKKVYLKIAKDLSEGKVTMGKIRKEYSDEMLVALNIK